MTSAVYLYRYDLSQGMAAQFSPMLLGRRIDAIWHTGITVFGAEYYFDGGVGISQGRPGETRFGAPLRRDFLGSTTKTSHDFVQWIHRIGREKYGPSDYHLLGRNCNHFSQDACSFLLPGVSIGEDIVNMIDTVLSTPLGSMLRAILESSTHSAAAAPLPRSRSEDAPTAAPSFPSSGLAASQREDLDVSIAILESVAVDDEAHDGVLGRSGLASLLSTLRSIATRIVRDPANAALQRLKKDSNTFRSVLLGLKPTDRTSPPECPREALVRQFLSAMGFEEQGDWWLVANGTMDSTRLSCLEDIATLLTDTINRLSHIPPPVESQQRPCAARGRWAPISSNEWSVYDAVGEEHGSLLFSIRLATLRGKLSRSNAATSPISGHVLSPTPQAVTEISIVKEMGVQASQLAQGEVLLLPPGRTIVSTALQHIPSGALVWLPAWLLRTSGSCDALVKTPEGEPVARARRGAGTHPAMCVATWDTWIVPYGGAAVHVGDVVEWLCDWDCLDPESRNTIRAALQDIQATDRLFAANSPIQSVDELLSWTPSGEQCNIPFQRRRSSDSGRRRHLLVCHDFKGGYLSSDTAMVTLGDPQSSQLLRDAYTIDYWHLMDVFVYFSHARVSVPPEDWIRCSHSQGVPILGTFITEWELGRREWLEILTNPTKMGLVITKLVDVAVHHGFDGYLLNVENEIATAHVQRLVAFVKFLKSKLHERVGGHARVIWYDAVTSEGRVSYQNALRAQNKPFFDASDGIFLNYFWDSKAVVASSLNHAAPSRTEDVFVGVDVFGRSSRFGRGGFTTDEAVAVVDAASPCATSPCLSVALFAPAWTLENESNGQRADFLKADAKFWERLAPRFLQFGSNMTTVVPQTIFLRGAGQCFFVAGHPTASGGWVQRSSQSCTAASQLFGWRRWDESTQRECLLLPRSRVSADMSSTNSDIGAYFVTATASLGDQPPPFMGDTFLRVVASSPHEDEVGENDSAVRICVVSESCLSSNACTLQIVWRRPPEERALSCVPPRMHVRKGSFHADVTVTSTFEAHGGWRISCYSVSLGERSSDASHPCEVWCCDPCAWDLGSLSVVPRRAVSAPLERATRWLRCRSEKEMVLEITEVKGHDKDSETPPPQHAILVGRGATPSTSTERYFLGQHWLGCRVLTIRVVGDSAMWTQLKAIDVFDPWSGAHMATWNV